jgi:hypothetical protein
MAARPSSETKRARRTPLLAAEHQIVGQPQKDLGRPPAVSQRYRWLSALR